jgi:CheY-like chemotaxis protein
MTKPMQRRRVLLVDDDRHYLIVLSEIMQSLSQGTWDVLTAENAGEALPLAEEGVDLIVIDVRMPVVDGMQFLRLLNRRHPELLKVVLTAHATEAGRAACLSSGAELFLEKPAAEGSHERLFKQLDDLMHWQPTEGFRGVLRQVSLHDVIHMQCLAMSSSVIDVQADGGTGKIFIQAGALVHAEAGTLQGEAALFSLLCRRGGDFRLSPSREAPPRTIEGPWEYLLMESARRKDEGGQLDPSPELSEPVSGQPATGQPPDWAAPEGPTTATGRRIDEFLICGGDGRVLYEWGCRNSDLWINFLEFLSQKSRRLAQGSPMGEFHRLEASSDARRLVALVREDRGVVVCSREIAKAG